MTTITDTWATWTGAGVIHWVENGRALCGFPRGFQREFQRVPPPDVDQVCRLCRRVLDKRERDK